MNTDKNSIGREDFLANILITLRETFEGSPAGEPSVYLDRGAGFFATLENLSAEAVSETIGGTSIVAHTEHAKFYLDRICEFIGGRTEPVRWEQSWLIETVSDEEWQILRDGLRKSYENVLLCIAEVGNWNDDKIGDVIAILAHTAYHLGAIRQMKKTLDEGL